jgi:hypothetical protein
MTALRSSPPQALAHLFPELPAWAVDPFLGGEYVRSARPLDGMPWAIASLDGTPGVSSASDLHRDGLEATHVRWTVHIQTTGHGATLSAHLTQCATSLGLQAGEG